MRYKAENKILRSLLIRIYKIAVKQYKKTHSELAFKIIREFTRVDLKWEKTK